MRYYRIRVTCPDGAACMIVTIDDVPALTVGVGLAYERLDVCEADTYAEACQIFGAREAGR